MDTAAVRLMERLGLSDEELCTILAVDPISVITDELGHRPELGILLALTDDAIERVGPTSCAAGCARAAPPAARSTTCWPATSRRSSGRSKCSPSAAS